MNILTTYMATTYLVVLFSIPHSITGRSLRVKREYSPKNWYLYWSKQLNNQYGRVMSGLGEEIDFSGSQVSTAATATSTTTAALSMDSANTNDGLMNQALPGRNQIQILQECNKIEEKEFRGACKSVVMNHILKNITGVWAYVVTEPQFAKLRAFSMVGAPLKQVICDKEIKCSTDNLSQMNKSLGLSPSTECYEFDPNRFPQWLTTAQCLCEGCINATTGEEDTQNVFSEQDFVDIEVLRKERGLMNFADCTKKTCRVDVVRIAIGCRCKSRIQTYEAIG